MDTQQAKPAIADHKIVLGIHEGASVVEMVVLAGVSGVLAQTVIGVLNSQEQWRQQIIDFLGVPNIATSAISAIGISTATMNTQNDLPNLAGVIAEMFPSRPVVIEQEAIAALIAETGYHFGLFTLCDVDSSVYGLNRAGERIQVGGWGYPVRAGGSYYIGYEALNTITEDFDRTGGSNRLTQRLMTLLNLNGATDLRVWLQALHSDVDAVAELAEAVIALEDTDAIARGIVSRAADNLAFQAQAAARAFGLEVQPFPLVMAGSLFTRSRLLRTQFIQKVQTLLPGTAIQLLQHGYAFCAGRLALERLGVALAQIDLNQGDPARRATEQRNPLTLDIDTIPTLDFVRLMNIEDSRVPRLIESQLIQIAKLIDGAAERFDNGGRLLFVGAGTSGRLAVLDAAECRPTFGTTLDEVVGILAGGERALIHSIEGAEDDEPQGRAEIARREVTEQDTVIGIAASGSTPFVIGALHEALHRGALTGCIVNSVDSAIAKLVEHPIVIPTGSEVIMGSTRLKAGTAQKLVLNMISTGVMVRVGKTYGNLMVNMQMSNTKLRGRAAIIVAEATGLPTGEAVDLLERCDGEMKTAIASYRLNISPAEARRRLHVYKGNLARCLGAAMNTPSKD